MSSLFNRRINSSSIQYGESVVISGETEEETVSNLAGQKRILQREIAQTQQELEELKASLKDLFTQKDNIIENAKKTAEDINAKAALKAEEIINQANNDKVNIINEAKEQGQKQGFEAGYNDGMEQFKLDYIKQINAMEVLSNAAFEVKNEIVFSSETEILELALLIAEKVIQAKFENDTTTALKNMTQTAISLLKEKEDLKIVVNPKLVEYAQEMAPEIASRLEDIKQIKIIQDKAVSPDGVVVESISSRIDARISTQLETLARTLLIDRKEKNLLDAEVEEKIKSKIEKVTNND